MGVIRKVSVHMHQFTGGVQFVGIRYRTPIDFEDDRGPEGIGLPVKGYVRGNAQDLLDQGILQEPVIKSIGLFLTVQGIHGTVAQPKGLFKVPFIVARIEVIEKGMKQFEMGQGLHFQVLPLRHEGQGDDVSLPIHDKGLVHHLSMEFDDH